MSEKLFLNNNPEPIKSKDNSKDIEQVKISARLATVDDLEECKRIRLRAISEHENKLAGKASEEKSWSDEKWLKYFFGDDIFSVLGEESEKSIGMLRAEKRESKKDWFLGSLYVPKGSNPFIFSAMFKSCLSEILKNREGGMIRFTTSKKGEDDGVNKLNSLAKILGFKEVTKILERIKKTDKEHIRSIPFSNMWELDLSDPEILKSLEKF